MTSDFLLAMLARASDKDLELARLVLVAGMREVALVPADMAARFSEVGARLVAAGARHVGILALSRLVAGLPACMGAAFELLAAREAAMRFSRPARLVLQDFLAAHARLLHQDSTLWAGYVVRMAVVKDGWVAAWTGKGASEPALGRLRPARLRWVEPCPSAAAADLVEDGLWAGYTRPFVAELRAGVRATLEPAAAYLKADMLGLEGLVGGPFVLPPLHGRLFAGATTLGALVAPAIKQSFADTAAVRMLNIPLVARRPAHSSPASTRNVHVLGAGLAGASVASVRAPMATRQDGITWPVAMWDRVLT